MNEALTGPGESTQVSLEAPPRCIDTTRTDGLAATRARPPGITEYPLAFAAANTRKPSERAPMRIGAPRSSTGACETLTSSWAT